VRPPVKIRLRMLSGHSIYAGMVFSVRSFLVAIPSAIKVFNWTATPTENFERTPVITEEPRTSTPDRRQKLPEQSAVLPHEHPVGLQHQFNDIHQQTDASTFGMWIFPLTEIMFFGGLRGLPRGFGSTRSQI